MRSQQEIIERINLIRKSNCDPTGVQIKMLTRKLSWNNAYELLTLEQKFDPKIKSRWEQTSCLDKKSMIIEIDHLMFQAYEDIIEFNFRKCIVFFQIFIIYGWLFHDDTLIRELMHKFSLVGSIQEKFLKFYFKGIWDLVCDNFGLDPIKYCRDWEMVAPPEDNHGTGNNGIVAGEV